MLILIKISKEKLQSLGWCLMNYQSKVKPTEKTLVTVNKNSLI